MGLDMYLEAEQYYSKYFDGDLPTYNALQALPNIPKPVQLHSVIGQVGYWRKANHIHNWFVTNVQNGVDECQRSYVTREQLTELRDLCNQVLANPDDAPDLLPTTSGFFFGSTDYDEYYFDDVRETVKILDAILDNKALETWSIYYRASW